MAEKKTLTQVKALEIAAEVLAADGRYGEAVMVLNKMIKSKRRSYAKRAAGPRPEAIDFYERVAEELQNLDAPITNKDMAARLEVSTQKVAAAFRYLVAKERVIRIEGEKKSDRPMFRIA